MLGYSNITSMCPQFALCDTNSRYDSGVLGGEHHHTAASDVVPYGGIRPRASGNG